ncbi:ArsR family transcriptional regulator [Cohnella xylanilytica]|uniref:Metalloregulator ArsR/SmtB family transcription factor n=1 Tax=Cohnella xylanilytica TaxID=557555 RepID=A0A841U2Z7_9BACL|nr:metalloregulator ArsR/SmtB family transcription factor [Cohnella xylanilytica]MBB6693862.1 metalloregulator ArsR/SmtB family transcription factor [Cohnella xylanilytica]GIO14091.1 ArsR family transcriptional regulator [Cohnella xylanilytica]
MDDPIFKALADPSRRTLLDLLHASDGRSLNELCAPLDMSRFGVMKHLNILEEAGLITTRKVGREKLHYLNAVPIRQIYDRWVSKYAEPWAAGLTALQNELERETNMTTKPRNVNRIAIKAKPEQVWQALTEPAKTSKFWFNCSIRSDWQVDSAFELWSEDGAKKAEGVILELDPPRKLTLSWRFVSFPGVDGDSPSRMTWEIDPHAEFHGVTLVTVVHDEFEQAAATAKVLENGVPIVLSGLKSLLETGSSLTGA